MPQSYSCSAIDKQNASYLKQKRLKDKLTQKNARSDDHMKDRKSILTMPERSGS